MNWWCHILAWPYRRENSFPLALIRAHTEWRARISYFIQNKILTVGIKWREFFLFSNKIRIRLCPHWLCVCLLKTFPVIIITAGREENTDERKTFREYNMRPPCAAASVTSKNTHWPLTRHLLGECGTAGPLQQGSRAAGRVCVSVDSSVGG